MTFSQLLKIVLFSGASLLAALVFVFTQQVVGQLSAEVASTSRVLAQLCAQASFPAVRDPEIREILTGVIANLDFPIVITDKTGTPRAWRRIDVSPDLVPNESLDSLKAGLTVAPVIAARVEQVRQAIRRLDRRNPPIQMEQPGSFVSLGAVHYGEPAVLERLHWVPLLSVVGALLLVVIGLSGLAIIRQAEKRSIWVGMAKETAHQLGTPLSSLLGWVDLLRAHASAPGPGRELGMPAAEVIEAVNEMERDLGRLNKVAQRFSRVGSKPDLREIDVVPVVREVVSYMARRMPKGDGGVEVRERYDQVPRARIDPELLQWALENLIANALNALDKSPRVIEVSVIPSANRRAVEVLVTDNGRGMTRAEQKRAFEPGYTTRQRGWGLGLPLARRVVHETHRGRLSIRRSMPGEGTTMAIRLPL